MKRDPFAIIHRLAKALGEVEPETRLNPNEIARRAGISWETAAKYSRIISVIQNQMPRIELGDENEIVVLSNRFLASYETREGVLQRLFYAKAFGKGSAIKMEKVPPIDDLLQDGLIRGSGDLVWLTLEGIPQAFSAMDGLDSEMHRAFASIGRLGVVSEHPDLDPQRKQKASSAWAQRKKESPPPAP